MEKNNAGSATDLDRAELEQRMWNWSKAEGWAAKRKAFQAVVDLIRATPQHSVTEQAPRLFETWWTMKAIEYKGKPFTTRREAAQDAWNAARAQPLASTAATQPEQASERGLFEAWGVNGAEWLPAAFKLDADGEYADDEVHGQWRAWKAGRAALAIPASTAPAQPEHEHEHEHEQANVSPPFAAPAGQHDASIAKLEKVAKWIDKFPVPTDGATTNYCRVHDVIAELRADAAAGSARQGGSTNTDSFPASTAASEQQASDLAWHKEALAAVSGKLRAVWLGVERAVEKYSGEPCMGEPFDRLDELLRRLSGRATIPSEADERSDFAEWLAREMPAGTVIGDPAWWAPRILKAALTHRATTATAGYKLAPIKPTPDMWLAGLEYMKRNDNPHQVYVAMLAAAPDIATRAEQQADKEKP